MSEQKRIIKEKECAALTGLCRTTRYNLIKEGKFPKPFKIGFRQNAWLYEDVQNWIENQINQKG